MHIQVKLSDINGLRQIWFADDATLYGNPDVIMKAWDLIKQFGPKIGFVPNHKSTIYLPDRKTEDYWKDRGLTFTTDGLTILGAPIGNDMYISSFCEAKLKKVAIIIDNLTTIGKSHPQQAWTLLSKSTKFKS